MSAIAIDLQPDLALDDATFARICRQNPHCKFERTAAGELVIVALTGGRTGQRNSRLTARLVLWNEETGLGEVFDASTGFKLPNGAIRSPDVAWISRDRWLALSTKEQDSYPPLCPDFVVELKSPSDDLGQVQAKMQEYLNNGLRLGWLLDPAEAIAQIYRPDRPVETLKSPPTLSGDSCLPGFSLSLAGILDS